MNRFVLLVLAFALACSSKEAEDTGLDDGWWSTDESEDGAGGGGHEGDGDDADEGDGEEGDPAFVGYFLASDDAWNGALEVFSEDCRWEVEATGTTADGCADCLVVIAFTTGSPSVESDDCDEDLRPSDWDGASYTVGLAEDTASVLIDGQWLPFADSFFEDEVVGWYIPLE